MTAAIGPFAVEKGMLYKSDEHGIATVRIFNTNTSKIINSVSISNIINPVNIYRLMSDSLGRASPSSILDCQTMMAISQSMAFLIQPHG